MNQLKFDYLTKGGKDPSFLMNLEDLQDTYNEEKKGTTRRHDNSIFQTSIKSPFASEKKKAFKDKFYENYNESDSTRRRDIVGLNEKANIHIQTGRKTLQSLQQKMTSVEFGMKDSDFRQPKGFELEGESEEEKMLMEYKRQEEEAMEAISLISPYSDLYKYKLAQIKKLNQLKIELEKIVQEQKYQRMWQAQTSQKKVNLFISIDNILE
jgi:hypothetical protein